MRRRGVHCPACGCDVTDRVQDAVCVAASKRINRQHVDKVAKMLERAEGLLQDPERYSAGDLWRGDVRAIRYVFNRLVASVRRGDEAHHDTSLLPSITKAE